MWLETSAWKHARQILTIIPLLAKHKNVSTDFKRAFSIASSRYMWHFFQHFLHFHGVAYIADICKTNLPRTWELRAKRESRTIRLLRNENTYEKEMFFSKVKEQRKSILL